MRALLLIVLLLMPASPVLAQNRSALETALEQALAERRYQDFTLSLLAEKGSYNLVRTATWMRERILAGEGAFMVGVYASTLWRVAGPPPQAHSIRETAAIMVVYLNSMILLDGLKCADRSAASERLQVVTTELRPILEFLRGLPEERRTFILDTAFRIEEQLASQRRDDDWVCRAGLQAMISAMKRGQPAQEVPTPMGSVGKTVQVQPDPDYAPAFRERSEWEAEQTAQRPKVQAAMRASLLAKP